MTDPIDISHLPAQITPTPVDVLTFATNIAMAMSAHLELKGMVTRQELAATIATGIDPKTTDAGQQLLLVMASALSKSDPITTPPTGGSAPILRLVKPDE